MKVKIIKYLIYTILSVFLSYLGSHVFFVLYTTDPNAPGLEYILDDAISMSWTLGVLLFCFSMFICVLFGNLLINKLLSRSRLVSGFTKKTAKVMEESGHAEYVEARKESEELK